MHDIGIMQGRILPDVLDKLQVFPSRSWLQEFTAAKQLGFDYVELLYDRDECYVNPLVNASGLDEVSDIIKQNDLRIYSICADYFTKVNFLEDSISMTWSKLVKLLDIAVILKAKFVIVPFFDRNASGDISYLKHFLEKSKDYVRDACDSSVKVCIETSFSAKEMLGAIEETDSDTKICYDLGNATAFGYDVRGEIVTLGDCIALVHIKDRMKNGGSNMPLGQGDVDFESSFKAIKEINYKGNFTLETAIGQEPGKMAKKHFEFASKLVREIL